MKQYAIFVGVFALAACGGGGGHHGGGASIPDPVAPAVDMPDTVQSWSVPAGGDVATLGTVTAKAGDDSRTPDVFKFTLDESGKITSVNLDGAIYTQQGGKNEYVNVRGNETQTMNLETLGRDAGLSYADFGYAQKLEEKPGDIDRDFYVFAGGYDGKEITTRPNDATYTGTAVAYIESKTPGSIANRVTKTNDAKLVIDASGISTLTMNFPDWYNVVVKNGTNVELTGGGNLDSEFVMTDAMRANIHDVYNSQQFFGDGANATEVVNRVGFEAKDINTGREIEFDGAFGGKR